jgi:peptidoglycan/xylan/chitin deacetylase (PgdA/CDA1 family)
MQLSTVVRPVKPHPRKGRIIKLLISMGCFVGDGIWRFILKAIGKRPAPTYVILYYHDVPDAQRQMFARQMDMVLALTVPLATDDRPELKAGEHYSAITFDDGFENSLDNAVPELTKRNIPATFFVTVGFLNRKAEWWPASAPQREQKIASSDRWQELPVNLIKIGSHTVTHPHLAMLSEQDARAELYKSRVALMDILKRNILAFSFPYGEFTPSLVEWCYAAGYKQVFTTLPENRFRSAHEVLIGRTAAEPDDWPIEFRLKLLGAYRWLPFAISCKHKISKKTIRQALRSSAVRILPSRLHVGKESTG